MHKSVLSLALVGIAFAWATGTSTAFAQGAPEYEVLGIKLGSPARDIGISVDLKDAILEPKDGQIFMNRFTSDPMHFGAVISNDTNREDWMNYRFFATPNVKEDTDYLAVVFDAPSSQNVIGVKRVHKFSKDTMPSITALRDSLIEKYGQPVFVHGVDMNNPAFRMVWRKDTTIKYAPLMSCTSALMALISMGDGDFSPVSNLIPNNVTECGSWIQMDGILSPANKDLIYEFTLNVGDVGTMGKTLKTVNALAAAGASGLANSERAKGDTNKPKL